MRRRSLFLVALLAQLACPRASPPTPPDDASLPPPPDDDGCAIYATPARVGSVPEVLPELSGLAASRRHEGLFYAHNDSGHAFRLYALDATGTVRGSWSITGGDPADVEDLAVGPCAPGESRSCVFLGDIGDNLRRRTTLVVYRLPEPDALVAEGTLTAEPLRFRYPDGAHDAEGLVVHPSSGELGVLSKEGGGLGTLYVVEGLAADVVATARALGALKLSRGDDRMSTAADVHPRGERLLVRSYGHAWEARAEGAQDLASLIREPLVEVPSSAQPQSEAIAYAADGRGYLIGTEGEGEALLGVTCR